jgi:hypothetical protein
VKFKGIKEKTGEKRPTIFKIFSNYFRGIKRK